MISWSGVYAKDPPFRYSGGQEGTIGPSIASLLWMRKGTIDCLSMEMEMEIYDEIWTIRAGLWIIDGIGRRRCGGHLFLSSVAPAFDSHQVTSSVHHTGTRLGLIHPWSYLTSPLTTVSWFLFTDPKSGISSPLPMTQNPLLPLRNGRSRFWGVNGLGVWAKSLCTGYSGLICGWALFLASSLAKTMGYDRCRGHKYT